MFSSPSSSSPYYNASYPTETTKNSENTSSSTHFYPSNNVSSSTVPSTTTTTATHIPKPPPDDQEEPLPPPPATSNTYHLTQSGHSNWELPPGWKIAHCENDGRMYYFNLATGETRWSHPMAPTPMMDGAIPGGRKTGNGPRYAETPMTASQRPDSHQCLAIFSCILFPPLGIFALVHSVLTYRAWSQGRYGDAYDHSRQAYNFSWWSICIVVLWALYRYIWLGDWNFNWNFFE